MIKSKINYKTGEYVINDFSKVNFGKIVNDTEICGVKVYNFKHENGILQQGMGFRKLMVYAENDINSYHYELNYDRLNLEYINKVMYFKQYFSASGDTTHRLLIHGSDNKLYLFQMFSSLVNPSWVYELEFNSIPAVLEYKKDGLDSILISTNDKLVVWSTGRTPYEINNVPTITSMCVYNDILYCTIAGDSEKIWYTENLDPESVGVESEQTKYLNLTSGGGGGRKVVILKENVFVFCDYSIGRINTYVKKEPTYNQIYLTNAQIYPNTVSVCGDFAIFMTSDGLYKFSGTSVSKIDVFENFKFDKLNDYAVATTLCDDYYLALRLNFEDNQTVGCENDLSMKNNSLIKFNFKSNSYEVVRGVDIKDMLPLKAGVEEKIVVTFNSVYQKFIGEIVDTGNCFGNNYVREYSTNYIVQEDINPITIRKLNIDCSEGVVVKIVTENGEYVFDVKSDGLHEFQTIIRCNKFKIEVIASVENIYVNNIKIEYIKEK